MTVAAHWCPDSRKRPVFVIVCVVILGLAWLNSGEVQLVLWMSPLVVWFAAVVAFNRTEILVDDKRVSWKIRPFPIQRERIVKREEIVNWVYGEAPVPAKERRRARRLIYYAAGIERKNGKVMVIRNNFAERRQAEAFARRFADHTGMPLQSMGELRGYGSRRRYGWPMLVAFGLFAAFFIWVVAFQE